MTTATTTAPAVVESAAPGPARPGPARVDPARLRFRAAGAAVAVAGGACGFLADAGVVGVAAIGAVLAAVLVLARPQYAGFVAIGLVLSNAPVVLTREHGLPGSVSYLVPMLLAVSLGHRVFVRREALVLHRAVPWAVAFVLVQAVSALASRDPERSVAAFQTFFLEGFLLLVLVANGLRDTASVRAAVLVVVVVAGLLGGLSLVKEATGARNQDFGGFASMSQAVIGSGDGGDGSPRHAGPIGEQNRWAQTLAMVLPLAVALATTDRSHGVRLAAGASVVGIGAGIVFTYSRGAAVGLAITGLVATVARWVRLRTAVAVAVATLAVLVTVAPTFAARTGTLAGALSSVAGTEEANPLEESPGTDGSISNRAVEGQAALNVFLRHPAVGVGPDLFSSYFQDEARALGADRIVGVERQAHSLYLGMAAETGLLGLLAFGGTVAAIVAPLARARKRCLAAGRADVAGLAAGCALAVVTYLATGLFLHASYIRFFWLVAAVATALGTVAARTTAPPDTETAGDPPEVVHLAGGLR